MSRRRTSRRISRRTRRTSRRSRRTSRRSGGRRRHTRKRYRTQKHIPKNKTCAELLKEKIRINLAEYKKGKFVSPLQAIAVSYNELRARYPSCKQVFTKRRLARM